MNMWMVRAGEGGRLFDDFKNKGVIAIGWKEVKDLSHVKSPKEIKEMVKSAYPHYSQGQLNASAGQIIRFRFKFEEGDYVVTYDPERRIYMVGEIAGDYEYNTELMEYHHIRRVKWLGEIERDKLSTRTKNVLGSISTIFKLPRESQEEILNLLRGGVEEGENEKDEMERIRRELIDRANEFIKDRIMKLDWEEMQELVAGLLRAMGYKTMVSPRGPDRGRDIIASPDGLGLEDPRIVVEVKHRLGQVGAGEIRSFLGGLRQGIKGLYVSTGGFTKEAKYEAERSNIPLTLIDLDMLVDLIIQYYDSFDTETRALLPLMKIYWPI